jgi:hypothetical protein
VDDDNVATTDLEPWQWAKLARHARSKGLAEGIAPRHSPRFPALEIRECGELAV